MKKVFVGMVAVLILIPNISSAQVTDPVQRAAIIQMIEIILERIKELQTELAKVQKTSEIKQQTLSEEDRRLLEEIKEERRLEDLKAKEEAVKREKEEAHQKRKMEAIKQYGFFEECTASGCVKWTSQYCSIMMNKFGIYPENTTSCGG